MECNISCSSSYPWLLFYYFFPFCSGSLNFFLYSFVFTRSCLKSFVKRGRIYINKWKWILNTPLFNDPQPWVFLESTTLGEMGSVNFPAGSEESWGTEMASVKLCFYPTFEINSFCPVSSKSRTGACLRFLGLQLVWTVACHWVTSCPGTALWNKNFPP